MPEPGTIELREYGLPTPADGELLVEIEAAGICGSELHMFGGRHPLRSLALGHEFVGRVIDPATRPRDSAGRELDAGDLVTASYFEVCGECPECTRGDLNLCRNGYAKMVADPDAAPHFVGGLATHYLISARQWIYRVPASVPAAAAASVNCAVAQVISAVERAAVRPGERAVIQGVGGLGLYATAVCRERGADVVCVDAVATRLDSARRFGAGATISIADLPDPAERLEAVRAATGGEGADVVFDFAGVPEVVDEGIAMLRPGGRYVEVGGVLPGTRVELDLGRLTRGGHALLPVIRYLPRHLEEAIAFLERNVDRLPLEGLVDGRYRLDDVHRAFEDSIARRVNRAAILADPR